MLLKKLICTSKKIKETKKYYVTQKLENTIKSFEKNQKFGSGALSLGAK